MINKTLYRKDSKGKIRSLRIYTNGAELCQESGLIDGKKVTHSKVCKAKNIGKSNETSPELQAEIEANALITKKVREGYQESIADAQSISIIKPMLAKDYFKEKHKLAKYKKLVIQPKLDGVRCIIEIKDGKATAKSRQNVEFNNIPYILDELEQKAKKHPSLNNLILDGELYVHGKSFQEITKLVKNKPGEDLLEYHCYDVIDTNLPFSRRSGKIAAMMIYNFDHIIRVPTYNLDNKEELLLRTFSYLTSQGYEGMIVRVPDSKYKVNARSSDLLKYKHFKDIALPIVDITPNDANPQHGTIWIEYNGKRQKTGTKLSHEDREDLLKNKVNYIGKTAEIRYFEETDDGKLRFPVFMGIRIDK